MFDDLKEEEKQNNSPASSEVPAPPTAAPAPPTAPSTPVADNNTKQSSVEDIFSDTDDPQKPAVFQPKGESGNDTATKEDEHSTENNTKKILLLLGLFCGFIVICISGYYSYVKFIKGGDGKDETFIVDDGGGTMQDDTKSDDTKKDDTKPASDNKSDDNDNKKSDDKNDDKQDDENTGDVPEEADIVEDSDGDGLSDAEENIFGTNINSSDTDADGLSDDQEVKIFKTDPLSPDTDNDGYLDGAEVKAGYNPKGEGAL